EYVHGDRRYLARTVIAIVKVVIGLALLMPGLASLLTFLLSEGAPAPQALAVKSTGLLSLYGEPVIVLALFVLLMVLCAAYAKKGTVRPGRADVLPGALGSGENPIDAMVSQLR